MIYPEIPYQQTGHLAKSKSIGGSVGYAAQAGLRYAASLHSSAVTGCERLRPKPKLEAITPQ